LSVSPIIPPGSSPKTNVFNIYLPAYTAAFIPPGPVPIIIRSYSILIFLIVQFLKVFFVEASSGIDGKCILGHGAVIFHPVGKKCASIGASIHIDVIPDEALC
tara:strand:- start:654 stop:962 length:309 start_codon:yes stop_codon:yes gene_type:complete